MSTKPNVLLISTDHWPAALLGAAGHPDIQTPTLDELCRSGVRFSNAYAECPGLHSRPSDPYDGDYTPHPR